MIDGLDPMNWTARGPYLLDESEEQLLYALDLGWGFMPFVLEAIQEKWERDREV